jgi:hypothetical protein
MIGHEKPELEDLVHHGVKGMKWGKRKARPTTADIKSARIGQDARYRQLQRAEDHLNLTGTKAPVSAQKKAVRDYQKAESDFLDNPDRAVAARMTRGEKAVTVILAGPFAVLPIAGSALISRSIEKSQAKNKK